MRPERGSDVEDLVQRRGKRGRPTLGTGRSRVESVRLDPELRELLPRSAEQEGLSVSELIREALRQYLAKGRRRETGLTRRQLPPPAGYAGDQPGYAYDRAPRRGVGAVDRAARIAPRGAP